MEINVQRKNYDETSTTGTMTVDGVFQCYTLEPRTRAPGMVGKIFQGS
jgi:hypothetical protein